MNWRTFLVQREMDEDYQFALEQLDQCRKELASTKEALQREKQLKQEMLQLICSGSQE